MALALKGARTRLNITDVPKIVLRRDVDFIPLKYTLEILKVKIGSFVFHNSSLT